MGGGGEETLDSIRTGAALLYEESLEHINVLELTVVLFGLKSLIKKTNKHMKILCDNTTAVNTVNNMGTSRSIPCDKLVKAIWQHVISRHLCVTLTATHLPGRFNEEADTESQRKALHLEWKLNKKIFTKIKNAFGKAPAIDLFASCLIYQIKPLVSFRPDLECFAVNAFLIPWEDHFFYASPLPLPLPPPFNMIPKVLQKVHFDQAEGILIVPKC